MTFLTTGEKETRAWTIEAAREAPQAAGKIHSDIERGFIRAEVIDYDDYVQLPHARGAARGREDPQRRQGVRHARGRRVVRFNV